MLTGAIEAEKEAEAAKARGDAPVVNVLATTATAGIGVIGVTVVTTTAVAVGLDPALDLHLMTDIIGQQLDALAVKAKTAKMIDDALDAIRTRIADAHAAAATAEARLLNLS